MSLVWGGIHPTLVPETAPAADYMDYIVTGEAEESAVKFAQALREGRLPEGTPGRDRAPDGAGLAIRAAPPEVPGRARSGPGGRILSQATAARPYLIAN